MQTHVETQQTEITQEQLLDFLLAPASYPHQPAEARLVQTHMSFVIIVSPYVYKVKKPINLGFVDFSTLEKRRYFTEQELVLNRRLCAETYLEVVPVSLLAGQLVFGAGEEVVEYAVKMREMDARYFLPHLLEHDEVAAEDMHRIARKLADFYAQQTPSAEIARWGKLEHVKISTDENFAQTEEAIGQTLTRPMFEGIRAYTNSFYARHQQLFAQRVQENRILDCHGDLHAEHIHLTPQDVCIYDCIEFNERLRYIDVANDVAFLAMDLDHMSRSDLAQVFVSQMARLLDDSDMLRLMDFYKCYRAYVRGKVETMRSNEPEVADASKRLSRLHAQEYFRLALQYAIAGSQPAVLLVMGRIGSGKSTLAKHLAGELGWANYASDVIRKDLAGLPMDELVSDEMREVLYTPPMKKQTYDTLAERAEQHVRAGESVILDATFGEKAERDRMHERLEHAGATCSMLEVQASDATIKQRLAGRDAASAAGSDARLEEFAMLAHAYEPPQQLEQPYFLAVPTEQVSVEETVRMALQGIAELHTVWQ
jgi:aminoglycoside phosphotransferase family enzyme/predicted kinase